MSGRRVRDTIPVDLSDFARQSEREFEAAAGDIRPVVPLHAVPWLVVTLDQVKELPLDSRAGLLAGMVELGVIELHDAG